MQIDRSTHQRRFGLKDITIEQINNIFSCYSTINSALIYGSRAIGNYREGSDIDLVLIGNELTEKDLLRVSSQLDDLSLPYQIDLSIFHLLNNESLKEHISQMGLPFYSSKK